MHDLSFTEPASCLVNLACFPLLSFLCADTHIHTHTHWWHDLSSVVLCRNMLWYLVNADLIRILYGDCVCAHKCLRFSHWIWFGSWSYTWFLSAGEMKRSESIWQNALMQKYSNRSVESEEIRSSWWAWRSPEHKCEKGYRGWFISRLLLES